MSKQMKNCQVWHLLPRTLKVDASALDHMDGDKMEGGIVAIEPAGNGAILQGRGREGLRW